MSSIDTTEAMRKDWVSNLNAVEGSREYLEKQYHTVWDTSQLSTDFKVISFLAPLVMVRRKSDGIVGTLEFQHRPRYYFNFLPDSPLRDLIDSNNR